MKICYNPNTKNYIQGNTAHNILLYNAKKHKNYDNYIRCIIDKGILYIRVFYPYNDIDTLTSDKLYQSSYTLQKLYIKDILDNIKKHNTNIMIKDIIYNVNRQILESKGLYNL